MRQTAVAGTRRLELMPYGSWVRMVTLTPDPSPERTRSCRGSMVLQLLAPAGDLQIEAYKPLDTPERALQGQAVVRAAPGSSVSVELQLVEPTPTR